MKLLSILTVTKAEHFTPRFLRRMKNLAELCNAEFVIAGDGAGALPRLRAMGYGEDEILVSVESKGYMESVLDKVVNCCGGRFILRLDDDESVSPEMFHWLVNECYTERDHWKFPRAHLWHRESLYITNAPLWPDHQTRLSVRKKSGGRHTLHSISPYGAGALAPVPLEHWKFLVKTREEREAIADRNEGIGKGFGRSGMLPFNVPEEFYSHMELANIGHAVLQAQLDAQRFQETEKVG